MKNSNTIYSLNSINHANQFFINWFATTHERFKDEGNRYTMRCKLCGDSHKSKTKARLNYYKESNSLHCFNCGFGGSPIYYMSQINKVPIYTIKQQIFREYGFNSPKKFKEIDHKKKDSPLFISREQIYKFNRIWNQLEQNLPDEAKDWCLKRKFKLAKFTPEGFSFRWSEKLRYLAIPWYSDFEICYIQFRNISEDRRNKYLFIPDMHRPPFFNLNRVNSNIPYIFICESAIDSIFIQNGIAAGTLNVTTTQIKILKEKYPNFEICLMPDNINVDQASRSTIFKLIEKFPDLNFFKFPDKYNQFKDIGAIIRETTNKKMLSDIINEFSDVNFLIKNSITAAKLKVKLTLKM